MKQFMMDAFFLFLYTYSLQFYLAQETIFSHIWNTRFTKNYYGLYELYIYIVIYRIWLGIFSNMLVMILERN